MPRVRIHITGIVQGVGMRPFVYREAIASGIGGSVLNATDGVHIDAFAPQDQLDAFVEALSAHAPAAARIDRIDVQPCPDEDDRITGFSIVASDDEGARTTLVSPDIATCPDCLRELFDPTDRRYHYPFINCTNCGPRYTIIEALPYDRPLTSMGMFPMCAQCAAEYADPLDRRFHAQPDACFDCGPHITWRTAHDAGALVGATREDSDAIIERCCELLRSGDIVAIKGLGGFHLACDAANEDAVRALRLRKRRPRKALAIMVRDLSQASRLCRIDDTELALLTGSIRPIVLLRRKPGGALPLAPSVALDLPELGVMLPYTPLQHLIMASFGSPIVMTSGNVSGEPIEIDDGAAWERLVASGIADALLGNDRKIRARFDDSVVRVVTAPEPTALPVRRARGYAPRPLELPATGGDIPTVLACGAEQKATLAYARKDADGRLRCFVSQHIGDVGHAPTLDAWHEAREHMARLFDLAPQAIACDLHPSFLTSLWARTEARRLALPLIEVQHHHAHIASVIAEKAALGVIDPSAHVVGIAFDGTGAGSDGTIWGGEFLIADLASFKRAAHLAPWPLPGGEAAVRDPKRCAYALLREHGLLDHPGASNLCDALGTNLCETLATMIDHGINSPLTSSAGRFLDACAAILGICSTATYEGEPAIELEAAANRARRPDHPDPPGSARRDGKSDPSGCCSASDGVLALDPAPMLRLLLDGLVAGIDTCELAYALHVELARMTAEAASALASQTGVRTAALSGGVFMNRILLEEVRRRLAATGLKVLIPSTVPVNDGCIAYGQAAIACARISRGSRDRELDESA
ncbi:carbamoyltransferase HypF [Enorma phocaeensis]|uniref:carbamoyltransferase HypF n=1 Tax=Enorma phocaeensis TaxID=1871019 RepID=UPI000C81B661|nr:carbamoyltransferase HypF [Enorma phocaeensis]